MKKAFVILTLALGSLTMSAQGFGSSSYDEDFKKHEFTIFLTPGINVKGDTKFALELGLKYAFRFHPNMAWDAVKVSALAMPDHFSETLQIQALSGFRGITPVLFGNSTLYLNFGAGYGYYTDMSKGGFAWEIGAGINITPKISVGIVYNSTHQSGSTYEEEYSYWDPYWEEWEYDTETVKIKGSNSGFLGIRAAYTF